eukprot:snap_masked-scaffold_3-processed-gene-8.34-mRNA-1 protein AED:1.00 eAED:1.00 QI:0/0/0/0/1/1/2/0/66
MEEKGIYFPSVEMDFKNRVLRVRTEYYKPLLQLASAIQGCKPRFKLVNHIWNSLLDMNRSFLQLLI